MRLINTSNYQLKVFSSAKAAPKYAVLSHTWGDDDEEVAMHEMTPGVELSPTASKFGFLKIKEACWLAKVAGLEYVWVDTCCIDKSSSAELSEAINSMFKWYQQAAICYAFLTDWDYASDPTSQGCRWWKRGWTLQELLASREVEFYDKDWQMRGAKSSLGKAVSRISGIDEQVLRGRIPLSHVPIAVRMSWASKRETTREEDEAYCLLGIFDINMSMLYGEGNRAFQRLQEEIMKTSSDLSILGWKAAPGLGQEYTGLLAPSPREFAESRLYPTNSISIQDSVQLSLNEFLEVQLAAALCEGPRGVSLPILHHEAQSDSLSKNLDISRRTNKTYGVVLHQLYSGIYVRANASSLSEYIWPTFTPAPIRLKLYKNLSATESRACSRRILWITGLSASASLDFALDSVDPSHLWPDKTKPLDRICATQRDAETIRLHFKSKQPTKCPSFGVTCHFRNPLGLRLSSGYWECNLALANAMADLKRVPHRGLYTYGLASLAAGPSAVSRFFPVPQQSGSPLRRQVTLTLAEELDPKIGDVRQYLSIVVI